MQPQTFSGLQERGCFKSTFCRQFSFKLHSAHTGSFLPTTLCGKFPCSVAASVIRRLQNSSSWTDSEAECRFSVFLACSQRCCGESPHVKLQRVSSENLCNSSVMFRVLMQAQQAKGGEGHCNSVCEGDRKEFCGGMEKSSVYGMHDCANLPPVTCKVLPVLMPHAKSFVSVAYGNRDIPCSNLKLNCRRIQVLVLRFHAHRTVRRKPFRGRYLVSSVAIVGVPSLAYSAQCFDSAVV